MMGRYSEEGREGHKEEERDGEKGRAGKSARVG